MSQHQRFRYTDDSAMAKQIAASFVKQQAFDYKDIASGFSLDYHREPWRGYGASVVEVFSKLKANPADPFTPAAQQFNGSGSYGNGAGMRAHPIALGAYALQVHEVINHATNVGRITHSHPLGVGGGDPANSLCPHRPACREPWRYFRQGAKGDEK